MPNRPKFLSGLGTPGVRSALAAAALFGAAMPLSKTLLGRVDPWLLAGLLYLGSGLGLAAYRLCSRAPFTGPKGEDLLWIGGAIVSGGIVAPVLLLFGLSRMPASAASLLVNAEGIFTAALAWIVFREHVGRRIAIGMAAIALGAVVLSWPQRGEPFDIWPALLVLGACFAWGLDNNLTRRASLTDATWVAASKGLVAGSVNLILALMLGASLPEIPQIGLAMAAGLVTYGASLVLFVLALRALGTARTSAYFSIAPFIGAVLAIASGEPATPRLLLAGALMAAGIWLHLTEHHEHEHVHEPVEHEHEHTHDEHHRHEHPEAVAQDESHSHPHRHSYLRHKHPHFPDMHHRHRH